MFHVIQMYLKDSLGIEPRKVGKDGFSLPVCGDINFDNVYSCLSKFFLESGCEVYELSGSENFVSAEFANIAVRRENYAFRMSIYSEGGCILLRIT